MARLRSNFQSGAITDNPLTSGATSANSAGFAGLPVIASGDVLAISLDPAAVDGPPEIVWVTAHGAASTSVTIVRGKEGTSAREHASGTNWNHGPTVADYLTMNADVRTNGPPLTGSWNRGEMYADGQATMWICVVSGTPGLWKCASPGALIVGVEAFGTVTSDVTFASITTAPELGLLITPPATGDQYELELQATPLAAASPTVGAAISVFDVTDGAAPATTNEVLRVVSLNTVAGGVMQQNTRVVNPPAGTSRTYKALLWTNNASFVATVAPNSYAPLSLKARWA